MPFGAVRPHRDSATHRPVIIRLLHDSQEAAALESKADVRKRKRLGTHLAKRRARGSGQVSHFFAIFTKSCGHAGTYNVSQVRVFDRFLGALHSPLPRFPRLAFCPLQCTEFAAIVYPSSCIFTSSLASCFSDAERDPLHQGLIVERANLRARDYQVDLASNLNKTQMVSAAMPLSQQGGYYCNVCDCVLKDSLSYLDHINGKWHQRALGMSMRVEQSTVEQVR